MDSARIVVGEENSQTLADTTYDRLRRMILDGDLASGTRLQEKTFADRLGVSRTPVREAIARLTHDGLVTRAGGGAPTVNSLSVSEVIDILHVRRLIECDAARRAASARPDVEPLLALRARYGAFLEDGPVSPADHADLDERLHVAIADATGSPMIAGLVQMLKRKTRVFDKGSIPTRFEPGCREHIAILDAILVQNPDAAEEAMRRHIDNTREAILRHIHRLD